MSGYKRLKKDLLKKRKTWLITGVAGFIGSNLLETLLGLDQRVVGLDNFSAGFRKNLDQVKSSVTGKQWNNFTFVEGDIRDTDICCRVCRNVDYVLHEAALSSVPGSIEDPILANDNNIGGFVNILTAARDAGVKRFVYAASSSTYGDGAELPVKEDITGVPLSPYAVTKYVNELYADVFARAYGFSSIGLRYFNIFGPRQDPHGPYAAVIPLWFSAMIHGREAYIYGDGETTRDFCYVDNCVQANLLAACAEDSSAVNQIYNVACGRSTTLNELFEMVKSRVKLFKPPAESVQPVYRDFRAGDVRHSLADITKAGKLLGYTPEYYVAEGLDQSAKWYADNL